MEIKRGDIVTCVIAGDFGKLRPALVMQSDLYNPTHASVMVLPITTHLLDAPLFRIPINPGKLNGLKHPSQVMVDKLTAVRRDRLRERVGHASASAMARIEASLSDFLDLSK
jgi:mRNA interferase MazF